jgi:flagellin FlaB
MMKVFRNNEDAFTGLEAAIVLIAFVVVAAVFSYVVLGAGFFTTQKSQETVHSGVAMASSAVEVLGDVYGNASTPANGVDKIKFTLGLAAGATSVDMNKATMIFSTSSTVQTLTHDQTGGALAAGNWNITERLHTLGTANLMLEAGEQFVVEAMPPAAMPAYTAFNLEVKPPVGASLGIKRSVPANVNSVNVLY